MDKKYIIFIGEFGPCTQIHSLLDCIELIKLTNRILIEPIIFSHNKSEIKKRNYIKYSDILNLDNLKKNIPICNNEILFNKNLKNINYYCSNKDFKFNSNNYLLGYKNYYNVNNEDINIFNFDFNNFINDKDDVIILRLRYHLHLEYKHYINYLDVNKNIENLANEYILNTFKNKPFLSINIRRIRDDEENYKNWKDFFGFEFNELYDVLVDICINNNIDKNNIFISIKPKILKLYKNDIFFDKIFTYNKKNYDELDYYVEQKIAALSSYVIYTKSSYYSELIKGFAIRNNEKNENKNIICNIANLKNIYTGKKLCRRNQGIK